MDPGVTRPAGIRYLTGILNDKAAKQGQWGVHFSLKRSPAPPGEAVPRRTLAQRRSCAAPYL